MRKSQLGAIPQQRDPPRRTAGEFLEVVKNPARFAVEYGPGRMNVDQYRRPRMLLVDLYDGTYEFSSFLEGFAAE